MAALVVVLMVLVDVSVLMTMHPRLVAVFMPAMAMGTRLVRVLMLMFLFIVAAHPVSPPFLIF
jgi:hypothetical protein